MVKKGLEDGLLLSCLGQAPGTLGLTGVLGLGGVIVGLSPPQVQAGALSLLVPGLDPVKTLPCSGRHLSSLKSASLFQLSICHCLFLAFHPDAWFRPQVPFL